jgi:Nickel responsive protein SCO4226-like
MQRFLIERDIPGAAQLTEAELAAIAQKSTATMESLGVPYRWITSYVAGDKFYCVHEADDEAVVREHARRGGFPVTAVTVVAGEIGPGTA